MKILQCAGKSRDGTDQTRRAQPLVPSVAGWHLSQPHKVEIGECSEIALKTKTSEEVEEKKEKKTDQRGDGRTTVWKWYEGGGMAQCDLWPRCWGRMEG